MKEQPMLAKYGLLATLALAIGFGIALVAAEADVTTNGLILHEDFEDGQYADTGHCASVGACDESPIVSNDVARSGQYSLRSEVNPYRDKGKGSKERSRGGRSEISFNNRKNTYNLYDGNTYWISFSFYIAQDWEGLGQDNQAIIFNIHSLGRQAEGVPLMIFYQDGRLSAASSQLRKSGELAMAMGPAKERRARGMSLDTTIGDSEKIQKGEWNDVVIRYKVSSQPDGSIEVWLNGDKFADIQDVATYDERNDAKQGYYAKLGIYAAKFRSDSFRKDGKNKGKRRCGDDNLAGCIDRSMVVYHDDIKMYDAASGVTFEQVSP